MRARVDGERDGRITLFDGKSTNARRTVDL